MFASCRLDPVRFLFDPKADLPYIRIEVDMEVLETLRFCVGQGQMTILCSVKASLTMRACLRQKLNVALFEAQSVLAASLEGRAKYCDSIHRHLPNTGADISSTRAFAFALPIITPSP